MKTTDQLIADNIRVHAAWRDAVSAVRKLTAGEVMTMSEIIRIATSGSASGQQEESLTLVQDLVGRIIRGRS